MKKITANSKQQTALKSICKRAVIPIIFSMLFILSSLKTSGQAPSVVWWYNNGTADTVFLQTDVFSFRCYGGVAYTGSYDTTIVDSIVFRIRPDAANDVFFKSTSTLAQRLLQVQNIHNSGQMEIYYLNITLDSSTNYSFNNWFTIDNKILVNFSTTYPDSLFIDSFMAKYNLTLIYKPLDSLPIKTGCSYTYIFKVNIPSTQTNNYSYIADLLQDIYEDTVTTVCDVSPNVVNIRRQNTSNTTEEPYEPASPMYDVCGMNDAYADHQWYIHNDEFNEYDFGGIVCSPVPADGTIGADARICECWAQGLTGDGIKVCVIATGDVNFSPPLFDLATQAYDPTTMKDCSMPPCVPLVSNAVTGAGMSIGMYIGAKRNNNNGIAGIAEKVILSHIKIGDNFTSDASMIAALHEALLKQVDIIVTDYVSPIFSGAIKNELWYHHAQGRFLHPSGRGTIIIAPSSHTETNPTGTTMAQYPACYNYDYANQVPEVIGVIASNVYDQMETGWHDVCQTPYIPNASNYSFPTNYGAYYDVASPAAGFYDATAIVVRTPQDHSEVAIVGGVAALLLANNPYLTDIQMRDRIRNGADKVGGYNYTGPLQHSDQMAAGRINCINSFWGWPLNSNSIQVAEKSIKISTDVQCWHILFDKQLQEDCTGVLYDMSGNVIQHFDVHKGSKTFTLYNNALSDGLYIVNLFNSKGTHTLKATK